MGKPCKPAPPTNVGVAEIYDAVDKQEQYSAYV